jgi:hypothetical protein
MPDKCHECGAVIPVGGACIDHFHAILALEHEALQAVPPSEGRFAHFCAVTTYVLQHPEGMKYTAEALAGARRNLADCLSSRATLEEVRAGVRKAADGPGRVLRREGEAVPIWPVESWPITAADVLAGGPVGYTARARLWAKSTLEALKDGDTGTAPVGSLARNS